MYFNGTKCQLFIAGCLLSVSAFAKDLKTMQAEGIRKPLCFVENKGQVLDENNHSRMDVQFKLSGKGVALFVGDGQLHYQFKDVVAGAKTPTISTYRMDVTLVGANTHAKVTSADRIDYHENYYIPQVGPEGVVANAYKKITYTNVYPNIDWVLYVKDGKVEYDFVVRPGGDPSQIKLQYGGATALSIGKDGSITAETPMGSITEKTPVAFETRTHKPVSSRFQLDGNVVSFATGKYNGSLTIDPYLNWSTYFGGTNEDVVMSIKTSTGGNIYATGYTASSGLGTTGTFQNTYGGGSYDAFVVKYPAAGNVVTWATYCGGTGDDMGMSIALDNASSGVYFGGTTTTTGTTLAAPVLTAYQNSNNGGKDMFLMKLNNFSGGRTWGTYIGGANDDEGLTVICDSVATSNVFIAGKTRSADMASTDGTSLNGTQDGYIAKFSSTGVNTWASYLGGDGDDEIDAIAVNNNTFIAATGFTNSTTGIALSGSLSGVDDGFLAYIKANGTSPLVLWSTYIGGSGSDIGKGLMSDALHNIYLVGTTSSSDNISSGVSYTNNFAGIEDAYLMKFNSTGTKIWGAYFGGAGDDMGNGVCTDQFGNIAIAGVTGSTGIASTGAYQTALSGTTDAFIAKYNTLGQKIYSTYFGKTGTDGANSIIAESPVSGTASAITIGGVTASTALSTTGAAQTTYGGGTSDGFVAKFYRDTIVTIKQPFIDTLLCPGTTFTIRDTVNFNFATGNNFRVQLSDASGNFAAPVQIGTIASTTNGPITCTIPVGTTPGNGYRIRIVSTNPAFTSVDNNININVVSSLPAPSINANTPLCVGMTLNLSASASYAVNSYSWSGPGSYSSTQQNPSIPSVTAANGGVYTVSVTHANNCPPSTNSINVLVNSFIPPTPTDSSNAPVCMGGTLNLFGYSNYPGIFTYNWSGPGGFSSALQNPVRTGITPADTGYYYLVDTLDGCPSGRDTIHITAYPTDTPNIVISVAPNDTVCVGTALNFTAAVTNAGFEPTYQWMSSPTMPIVGAVTSTWSAPTLTSGTTIWCQLTSSVRCPDKPHDTSNVITVTVLNNTPVVAITATPDTNVAPGATVTFHAVVTGPAITSYTWYLNNTPVPGVTTNTYILSGITRRDSVRVEVASNAVCANLGVSNTIIIHIPTAVANVSPEFENIELFPNPNNGSFTIKGLLSNISEGNVTMDITNAIGQTVYSGNTQVSNSALNQSVQVRDLPAGVYMLKLSNEGKGKVFRFVVE